MVKNRKLVLALILTCISITALGVQNMQGVKADPYHHVVEFDENKIVDNSYSKADDSYGNTWRYAKYEDGTLCIFGILEAKSSIEVPSKLDGVKVTGICKLVNLQRNQSQVPIVTSVKIPSSVIKIEDGALRECVNIEKIELPTTTTHITTGSFSETKWFKNLKYSNGFLIINNILIDAKDKSGKVVLPNNVWAVAEGVFANDSKITSVEIPKNIVEIRKQAFSNCPNLESADFKNDRTFVEPYGFSQCPKLTKGNFPIRNKIATYAFIGSGCFDEVIGQELVVGVSNKPEKSNMKIPTDSNSQESSAAAPPQSMSNEKSGWVTVGDKKYWLWSNGTKRTGWLEENGEKYYFYGNGQMATGFINLNGAIYYLSPNNDAKQGVMLTGWQKINSKWYYFNPISDSNGYRGVLRRGWILSSGKWYYLNYNGTMATNQWIGKYYVNSSGVWVK